MKICLIGPSYPFRGGIPHHTTLLYRNLKKRHDVKFYAFKRQYPKWLFPGKSDRDYSNTALKEEGTEPILDSINPVTWFQIYNKIRKSKPEIVIFPWWVSFWVPQFWTISWLVKTFVKSSILFLCHNVVEHEANKFTKICTKMVLKNGDYFIVHSEEDLRNLKRIMQNAIIKKCFHPTYSVFQMNGISKEGARKKIKIKGNSLLFFGFIRPYKGLQYLIEAMPIILQNIELTLLIVGEFWEDKQEYLKQIEDLNISDNVKIIDEYIPNEDIELYFSAADLIILPYVSATGSGIIQLAYGLNKPVVSTNVGALPEVVKNGKTGYVVNSKDPKALAEAVLRFYKENKENEFASNIKAERQNFSWDKMTNTIESFLLDKNGKSRTKM